jgi:hypothetical protein
MLPEDFGKKPINIEQAGNYLEKDFGEHMKREIEKMKQAPLMPWDMDDLSKTRFLKMAISLLGDKGSRRDARTDGCKL